ncbi:MAG TPA: LLM class flavin-dependent oxidoreductase [Trebonia sp.]|nr:LLM class flavin-dependent oxidoreductase [Trebonia sp.]
MLARAVASLDILSGGRVELGIGTGAFWDAIAERRDGLGRGRPAGRAGAGPGRGLQRCGPGVRP